MFFSFDLVNSTAYKDEKKIEWLKVFAKFYDIIKKEMKQKFPSIRLWKYIGDEVLFYQALDSRFQLFETIPKAYEVLMSSLKHLTNLYPTIFKPLSIKGTVWCAKVIHAYGEELEDFKSEAPNIALDVAYENNNSLRDFIGPDIDTGFRISHYAGKEKVVISANFASLLLLLETEVPEEVKKNLIQNLKIVSYEDLKGIWKNRYYPIIWYFKDLKKIEEDFDYDDRFRSKIINNICLGQIYDIKKLTKIFNQLGIQKDIDNLLELLKESESILENKKILSQDNELVPVKDP